MACKLPPSSVAPLALDTPSRPRARHPLFCRLLPPPPPQLAPPAPRQCASPAPSPLPRPSPRTPPPPPPPLWRPPRNLPLLRSHVDCQVWRPVLLCHVWPGASRPPCCCPPPPPHPFAAFLPTAGARAPAPAALPATAGMVLFHPSSLRCDSGVLGRVGEGGRCSGLTLCALCTQCRTARRWSARSRPSPLLLPFFFLTSPRPSFTWQTHPLVAPAIYYYPTPPLSTSAAPPTPSPLASLAPGRCACDPTSLCYRRPAAHVCPPRVVPLHPPPMCARHRGPSPWPCLGRACATSMHFSATRATLYVPAAPLPSPPLRPLHPRGWLVIAPPCGPRSLPLSPVTRRAAAGGCWAAAPPRVVHPTDDHAAAAVDMRPPGATPP